MTDPDDTRTAQVLDVLERRLRLRGELVGLWLFGSHARGRQRADSDLDLAFLARRPVDPCETSAAGEDLAVALSRDVDLVDLAAAPAVLRAQVVSAGRRLHAADRAGCAAFEMYALSGYARLAEERQAAVARFTGAYRGR